MSRLINCSTVNSRKEIARRLRVDKDTLNWLLQTLQKYSEDFDRSFESYRPLSDFHFWQLSFLTSDNFRRTDGKLSRIFICDWLAESINLIDYEAYLRSQQNMNIIRGEKNA